jgi:hypothetical protein
MATITPPLVAIDPIAVQSIKGISLLYSLDNGTLQPRPNIAMNACQPNYLTGE